MRLHRYVWEKNNGPVPDGYHVHHKDLDKDNNDISNLGLMLGKTHEQLHGEITTADEDRVERMRKNLIKNALPKASEWHGSAKGRKWHSEHGKDAWKKRKPKSKLCEYCGSEFQSITRRPNDRFCSNNCKSAWRRKQGYDNEERICAVCGKTFQINRYTKTKTCSRTCATTMQHQNRKGSRD